MGLTRGRVIVEASAPQASGPRHRYLRYVAKQWGLHSHSPAASCQITRLSSQLSLGGQSRAARQAMADTSKSPRPLSSRVTDTGIQGWPDLVACLKVAQPGASMAPGMRREGLGAPRFPPMMRTGSRYELKGDRRGRRSR